MLGIILFFGGVSLIGWAAALMEDKWSETKMSDNYKIKEHNLSGCVLFF